MWPFTKRKPRPTVQLRCTDEGGWKWWAVFVWKRDPFGGYWSYVKGSSDEAAMRALYNAHANDMAQGESIVVEQA